MPDFTLETSQTTAALDDALVKAQGQMKNATKDSQNPHFKSRYADLASIWEACKEALSKGGIAVTQWPIASDDSKLHLITRLAHKGEWMQARMAIPLDKQTAHGIGSAITYAKRYALAAALGVADEDDDGNAATTKAKPAKEFAKEPDVEDAASRWVMDESGVLATISNEEDVKGWSVRNSKALKKLSDQYPAQYEKVMDVYGKALERARERA